VARGLEGPDWSVILTYFCLQQLLPLACDLQMESFLGGVGTQNSLYAIVLFLLGRCEFGFSQDGGARSVFAFLDYFPFLFIF
jgi:hypothetical protein